MVFLEVTAYTWLVTGLGFAIVLLLLCLFVFVMMGLGALMQWIENPSKRKEAAVVPTTSSPQAAPAALQEGDDSVAVAFTLHLFYGIHDIDAPKLTIHSHHSTWNEHTFGINNLDR